MFKMFLKRNILETLTIFSCSSSLICIALNYLANISPITGYYFPIYVISLLIFSIAASFKLMQWVLHLNTPLKYNIDWILKNYPITKRFFPCDIKNEKALHQGAVEENDNDNSQLGIIAYVLEKKLVSSWYSSYISEEISFPFACKQLLDQMIRKAFKTCEKIEISDLYVDVCSIVVSHLKEYKKAVKRQQKAGGPLEIHYKKSHPIYEIVQKERSSGDHCTNILRLILKDVTPWELWDTSQSELLVRIMSKKLNDFIHCTLTDPQWILTKLHSLLKDKENVKSDIEVSRTEKIDLQVRDNKSTLATLEIKTENKDEIEPIVENLEINNVQTGKEALLEVPKVTSSGAVGIDGSPRMRQKRGRRKNNEVKIYDQIIEGSVKTWDSDVDLQCISLGQDLLASLDKDITLSRLWEQDPNEMTEGWSPNPQAQRKSPQPLWFGEDDLVLDEIVPQYSSKKAESPNTADVLLKDLQSTVTQAKHKIGDLQVDVVSQRKLSTDEAAGMMEGLLDFGIAGLKKGLRFTGLHDGQMKDRPVSPNGSRFKLADLDIDSNNDNMRKDDDFTSVVPPLVKQSRVTSQDSMWQSRASEAHESPEPEYEETADLSSSIAKLRSLLHQEEHNIPTWTAAEETRGRTHHYPCSKPVDTAALADEYDMSSDRLSPEQSNNMQRLDKMLSRTMTGVFNSLRTAVRDDFPDPPHAPHPPHVTHTHYKMAADPPTDRDLSYAMARLLGSVRPGAVDAALDSLHHVNHVPVTTHVTLDTMDYEEWCACVGARAASTLEVCAALGLGHSHVALRLANLLVADLAETVIRAWLKELPIWLKQQVLSTFTELSKQADTKLEPEPTPPVSVEEVCSLIMDKLPGPLYLLGSECLCECVRVAVSSVGSAAPNADVAFRLLDTFATHYKRAATLATLDTLVNNSFDIN